MYETLTTPVIVVLQTACKSNQSLPHTRRYLAEADAQMGGSTWAQKGSATESKPQRAAPQAGRPTHKVRHHQLASFFKKKPLMDSVCLTGNAHV